LEHDPAEDIDNAAIHGGDDFDYSSAFNPCCPVRRASTLSHEGGEFEVFEAFTDDLAHLTAGAYAR